MDQYETTNDSFVANDSLEYLNELRNKILNKVYTVSVKRGRSKVWQVFGKIETDTGEFIENYVSCRKCRKIFKFTNSTSNLVKHKCYIIMKNEEESNTHPVMANIDPKMKKNLKRIVLQWSIENCRPFDVIEDSGMQKLAEFLIATGAKYGQHVDVEDLLPQSAAISKSVAKLYPDYLEKLKTEVSSIRKVGYGLTIDVWRDEYLKATYLFLLIHYIKNGKLVTLLLGLDTIESANYTSDDVKSVTVEILQKFDCTLDDKAIIVTDKSNTMMEAFQSNDRIYCINHLLQSAMDEAIYKTPEIRELLKTTKKLFTFLRSVSNTFTSSAENVSPKRWSIHFHMLSSLADNWNEALQISRRLHEREESRIIENLNLQPITELLNIFKPFEEATKELECESRPTLHLAVVHIHRLMKLCIKNIDDVDTVKSFKVNLLNFFDTIVLKNMTIHHKIALYLFPPANKLISFSQSDKDLVRAECKRIMQTYIDAETSESNAAYSAIQFDDKQVVIDYLKEFNEEDDQGASTSGMSTINSELFTDFVEPNKKMNNTEEKVNNEIRLYEDTSVTLQDSFNLLQWWHLHETQFPLLYKTSCKILAVPATGVAAEKVIVKGRPLIFESRRTGGDVKPDFVNDVLFLHFNVEKNEMFYDMIMDENF